MRRPSILLALVLVGCAAQMVDGDADSGEAFDFEDGGDGKSDGPPFDQNNIVVDDLYTNSAAMSVEDVQAFLEVSPYKNRSWLADYTFEGSTAAQLIVETAEAEGINPIIILARMQTETSMVAKTVKPSQRTIDKALGCGCSDGASCTAFRGFTSQLRCGAATMRRWYDASVDGTGQWRVGIARKTLDPKTVTPANHATASLYQYTPWVLTGSGGNWLVWNVTRKYVKHAEANGLLH
jgi:hypothetical protein